jgi:cytochrome c-type biogenesis protein CcmH/NrfG
LSGRRSVPTFARELIALVALAGCATPLTEREWLEARSGNLSILTSAPREQALHWLEEVEIFRASVLLVTNSQPIEHDVPTEVTVFSSEREFEPFSPLEDVVGFFSPRLRRNQVALVAARSTGVDPTAAFFHEYTHYLTRRTETQPYPLWFEEGIAEFLGALQIDGDEIRVGTVPEHRKRITLTIPFDTLLEVEDLGVFPAEMQHAYYAYAWLVVHYLVLGRAEDEGSFAPQMTRYREQRAEGVKPAQAFESAFGIDYAALERRIDAYRKSPDPGWWFAKEQIRLDYRPEVRLVPRAEVALRLARLALDENRAERAEPLLEEALALAPDDPLTWSGLGRMNEARGDWDAAETAHRRALELRPDHHEVHLDYASHLLVRAAEGPDASILERVREHARRAIELAPAIPEGYALLGASYLDGEGEASEGIAALERAKELLPSNPEVLLWLATLYHRAGRDSLAAPLARQALAWSTEATALREPARHLLGEIERGK